MTSRLYVLVILSHTSMYLALIMFLLQELNILQLPVMILQSVINESLSPKVEDMSLIYKAVSILLYDTLFLM